MISVIPIREFGWLVRFELCTATTKNPQTEGLGIFLVEYTVLQIGSEKSAASGDYQRVMFVSNLAVYASFSSCALIP